MVYVGSLSLMAKKALGNQCHQANLNSILTTLPVDAAISGMDAVILGPADLAGAAGKKIPDAVRNRHPSICVIYLCQKDAEKKLFPDAPNVKVVKKITPDVIKESLQEFYGKDVQIIEMKYDSMNSKANDLGQNPDAAIVQQHNIVPPAQQIIKQRMGKEVQVPGKPGQTPEAPEAPETPITPVPPVPELNPEPIPEPMPEPPKAPRPMTIEDTIEAVKSVKDWEILRQQLTRDGIMRQLMTESSEFSGFRKLLDLWDVRINDIWMDQTKSNQEKLEALKDMGTQRQILQGQANSILIDKFIDIMMRVVAICSRCVDERVEDITKNYQAIKSGREDYLEQLLATGEQPTTILHQRVVELVGIEAELINMFSYIDSEGENNVIARLNEKLPSNNEFINEVIGRSRVLFYPENSESLSNKMFDALNNGRIAFSTIEDKLSALHTAMFETIVAFQGVSEHQTTLMQALRSNRVENVVIRDSLLKNCFHIFIGTEQIGLTSTVAAYAGACSHADERYNTLVIDLTGHAHYERYGYTVEKLDDFLENRIQNPLTIVVGTCAEDPEKLAKVMSEVKNRITYFGKVFVVLDASQTMALDQIGHDALTINYITNCTEHSLQAIADAYKTGKDLPNVGNKLIAIDSPVDELTIVNKLGMDIATTKFVPIPYMREVRKCAIQNLQLDKVPDICRVYEEAFRV